MKLIIVAALALVAVVAAAPSEVAKEVKIVRAEFVQQPDGGYVKNTETEDGYIHTEVGEVKEVLDEENKPHLVVVVKGQYSYTDPDGNKQEITYSGDEGGFHAEGPSIPKNAER